MGPTEQDQSEEVRDLQAARRRVDQKPGTLSESDGSSSESLASGFTSFSSPHSIASIEFEAATSWDAADNVRVAAPSRAESMKTRQHDLKARSALT